VVDGRLPFTFGPEGLRFQDGRIHAIQPGRVEIARTALTGVQASPADAPGAPPAQPAQVNAIQDFAYQAMENLAFETLTANVNSEGEDRLAVNFHIVGRHDPPQRQELRLTLAELISREFLKRELPLPSNTGIDLTLDTTFNINQIIADLLAVDRARRGEADPAPTVPPAVTTP
jgi:hypothetical protein